MKFNIFKRKLRKGVAARDGSKPSLAPQTENAMANSAQSSDVTTSSTALSKKTTVKATSLSDSATDKVTSQSDSAVVDATTDTNGASACVTACKKRTAAQLKHVAIIMDGNGRWAKKRGLPRTAGHAAGAEVFRKIATYCKEIGVEQLTVYAFSTENWKRPEGEVSKIMELLEKYLAEAIDSMEREGVRLRVLGDVSMLSPRLRRLIEKTDKLSESIGGMQANICINYGGRDEVVRAARKCVEDGVDVTEEHLSARLYSAGLPDPELVIRPGGEMRTSNFLLWQSAYSEFYFTDVLWPDFTPRELDKAIAAYNNRERRFGGI